MSKVLNIALVILIAVFVAMLVSANHKTSVLKEEHDRLANLYGELPVEDETQFYTVCTKSVDGGNREFHWRVYQPEMPNGISYRTRSYGRRGSGSLAHGSTPAKEFLATARFRVSDGEPELYYSFGGGSSVYQFRKEIREFVAEHWDQLEFEVCGDGAAEVVPADKILHVFRVKVPKELFDELPSGLSTEKYKQYTKWPLFEMFVGDAKTMEKIP